jgi:hypothetical protein
MKSPLFSEHFHKDNWTLVYFNSLREAFTKTKDRTALEPLFGQKKTAPLTENWREENDQQKLMEFGGSILVKPSGEALENVDVDE